MIRLLNTPKTRNQYQPLKISIVWFKNIKHLMSLHFHNKVIQFTLNNMSQNDAKMIEEKEQDVKSSLLKMQQFFINCTSKTIECT